MDTNGREKNSNRRWTQIYADRSAERSSAVRLHLIRAAVTSGIAFRVQ
jgi:hypothetical protein